jgi:hypothetical protein
MTGNNRGRLRIPPLGLGASMVTFFPLHEEREARVTDKIEFPRGHCF